MKIAIVTETFLPSTDGIVTRLCAAIQFLAKHGHEIQVIAPDLGVYEYAGAVVKGIPARPFFLYPQKKLSFPNRLVGRYLSDFQPDLVHVVNPAVLGAAAVFYGVRGKWPMVASYHTKIPEYADFYHVPFLKPALWWYLRSLHNRADLNLCTSQTMQGELQKHGFNNVCVWSRGVETARFGPQFRNDAMRSRLTNGQAEKKLLLFVGRLAAEKGIEQIRSVLEASSDFCLALVGDGPYRSFLEQHFQGTNTVFTGFLHGDDLAAAYASADIFVFPSTTETLGLVLLEAMASGLAVVAARSGPTCEQITDQRTGIVFDPGDPEGLVKAVLNYKDDELRMRIGKTAYDSVREFSWDGPSQQLLDYYMQVLRNRGWEDVRQHGQRVFRIH